MNAPLFRRFLIAALSCLALMASGGAHALFRAYLLANGNDANPCTVTQPCRLLPAALAVVDPNGEIWMVDSANFNTLPVLITKSVTILSVPGELGSVVGNGGHAIEISTAGVEVTLQNLNIRHLSGSGFHGVFVADGLHVLGDQLQRLRFQVGRQQRNLGSERRQFPEGERGRFHRSQQLPRHSRNGQQPGDDLEDKHSVQ